ncbi:MAG: hypothetical protein P1R58_11850 [bacterium]|nr:hypothetical protein [bacterium]
MSRLSKMLMAAALLCAFASMSADKANAGPIDYALCDVRVMYLYDDAQRIDWPTLFYLNEEYGCRIDLVSVRDNFKLNHDILGDGENQFWLHQLSVNSSDSGWSQSAIRELFAERYPDIVIGGEVRKSSAADQLLSAIAGLVPMPNRIFSISRLFKYVSSKPEREQPVVTLNGRELRNRYRIRMQTEIPILLPGYHSDDSDEKGLIRYEILSDKLRSGAGQADFVSGIERLRLVEIIDSLFTDGPRKKILTGQASTFIASFGRARQLSGPDRIGAIIDGYRSLSDLYGQRAFDELRSSVTDIEFYFRDLHRVAEHVALEAVGLNWSGRIILRDSPHGPKLKFRLAIGADSPIEVSLDKVLFHPYWDSMVVAIDESQHIIAPHQTFVREYLVDIERSRLESGQPDSLRFSAELSYRGHSMSLTNSLSVWDRPDLNVAFSPDYNFVPSISGLDIDRVIAPMSSRIVITKSKEFADTVKLDLKTPRGLFAGSYRSEHYLPSGVTRKEITIPFSISNLFEKGIQRQTISLLYQGKEVAADSALIRIASCKIDEKIKIGFLPDSSGQLEDILRMTGAAIQPLTDRTLENYDLTPFNVIVIGSGASRNNPSLLKIKSKLHEYLRYGGSILILGQPDDWPQGILPISFIPYRETVQQEGITNRIVEARVLSKPYSISDKNLFSSFYRKRESNSAAISPAEIVYVTKSGGAMLSVSRFGEGQIIYCGLPLMDMISRLNIEAIHLLANILNY